VCWVKGGIKHASLTNNIFISLSFKVGYYAADGVNYYQADHSYFNCGIVDVMFSETNGVLGRLAVPLTSGCNIDNRYTMPDTHYHSFCDEHQNTTGKSKVPFHIDFLFLFLFCYLGINMDVLSLRLVEPAGIITSKKLIPTVSANCLNYATVQEHVLNRIWAKLSSQLVIPLLLKTRVSHLEKFCLLDVNPVTHHLQYV